jgi:hypothetical protein
MYLTLRETYMNFYVTRSTITRKKAAEKSGRGACSVIINHYKGGIHKTIFNIFIFVRMHTDCACKLTVSGIACDMPK